MLLRCYLGLALPLSLREFPMWISAPFILLFLSSRIVTVTALIVWGLKRSSLHHAFTCVRVPLQDPWFTLLSWFPSIALSGLKSRYWLDWVAFPVFAIFGSGQFFFVEKKAVRERLQFLHWKVTKAYFYPDKGKQVDMWLKKKTWWWSRDNSGLANDFHFKLFSLSDSQYLSSGLPFLCTKMSVFHE